MEIFVSAVLGELATRSISFFISKYSKSALQDMEVRLLSLQRILLRAQIIVDEATGRHITNQGMLRQLSLLRDAMYRGYYVLDAVRYGGHQEDRRQQNNQTVSHSWVLSKFNCAKRLGLRTSSSTRTLQQLEESLHGLRTMILDVTELVMFLTACPRLHRQPYCMHFLVENCMFGRQMEMEVVINFLLHTQPFPASDLDRFDVLPIVGASRAGKSTLVAHVCQDERVRGHFPRIVFFRLGSCSGEDISALRNECAAGSGNGGRLLLVIEVFGDLDEDQWETMWSLSTLFPTSGSKIIITSRSDKITKLGTTQPLTLKLLSREAFWYFFKLITFGSTDPDMHPRLVYLAMEIAKELNGSLMGANITAWLLRDNFNVHFWLNILLFMRGFVQNHLSKFGKHPSDLLKGNRPTYFRRMGTTTEDFLVLDQYQTYSAQDEVPNITFQDVMYGNITPRGIFKTLAWKSRIPPYHCYIYTCEIRELHSRVVKRKRSADKC
uniref:Uncharacterized protein n=1 Tax=Avena sativa TaxID=4498 RepID=A0ACD5WU30_AVESA